MFGFLVRPRWLGATLAVVVIAVVFANLGLWQLRRHDEQVIENRIRQARLEADPLDLETLLLSVGDDLDSLEYRRATATGRFEPADEVLWRGQVAIGSPGFDVVTPLVLESGTTLLVDRGWVPLTFDTPPVEAAPPPAGVVVVSGIVRLGQTRAAVGPVEPEGLLRHIARVDLERLASQYEQLAPVWLQVTEDDPPMGQTRPAALPDLSDEGPHRSYAVQWFAFAVIGVVGYGLIIKRASQRITEQ